MKIKFIFFLFTPVFLLSQTNSIGSTGNIGIGTTSPTEILDVKSSNLVLAKFSDPNLPNSYFSINRGSGVASRFVPSFSFVGEGTDGVGGFLFAQIPNDRDGLRNDNLGGALIIHASLTDGSPLVSSKILNIRNGNSTVFSISANGNISVGNILNPSDKLTIDGNLKSEEIKVVNDATVPDYVFKRDYNLPSIDFKQFFVEKFHHLPSIPSSNQIKEEGLILTKFIYGLLKEVEESTLHLIELNKRITELENKLNAIKQ